MNRYEFFPSFENKTSLRLGLWTKVLIPPPLLLSSLSFITSFPAHRVYQNRGTLANVEFSKTQPPGSYISRAFPPPKTSHDFTFNLHTMFFRGFSNVLTLGTGWYKFPPLLHHHLRHHALFSAYRAYRERRMVTSCPAAQSPNNNRCSRVSPLPFC